MPLVRLRSGVQDYTDTAVQGGVTYYYRVFHVRGSKTGQKSPEDAATPGSPDPLRPQGP